MPDSDIVPNSITDIKTFDEEFPRMAVIIFPHHKAEKLDPEMSSGDLELATMGLFRASKTAKYKIKGVIPIDINNSGKREVTISKGTTLYFTENKHV